MDEITLAGVRLTHPERPLWEDMGVTKRALAEYYLAVADWILPHVANRPLALVRCPSGTAKTCFFAKHPWAGLHESVTRIDSPQGEGIALQDVRGLVALVQAGVLEIHPWGATLADLERPDRMVFDLDPGEGVGFAEVMAGARAVRDRLDGLGLISFLKTSGGKGLHVVVPLAPEADWDRVKDFAAGLAKAMAADEPDRYTATMAKAERAGRIFVDYLRNTSGATAVAPYSPRARPGAPVATPLAWSELDRDLSPSAFTVTSLPARLSRLREDPWAQMATLRQTLPS